MLPSENEITNVINDGKHQLIDQLSDRLPRLIHIERDEISLYYITQTLIQLQFNLKYDLIFDVLISFN